MGDWSYALKLLVRGVVSILVDTLWVNAVIWSVMSGVMIIDGQHMFAFYMGMASVIALSFRRLIMFVSAEFSGDG